METRESYCHRAIGGEVLSLLMYLFQPRQVLDEPSPVLMTWI